MKTLNITLLALALATLSSISLAATPINQTRALNADGDIDVENVSGLIKVRVWNQPKVQITGSLGEGVEKLIVEGDANTLRVKVKYKHEKSWFGWGRGGNHEETRLELMVPIKASLSLDAVSANIDVQGSAAPRMHINSVSGDCFVLASSPGKLSLDTVSGNVTLKLTSPQVSINTVSGDLKLLGHLNGRVEIESVSGNVELDTPVLSQLQFNTVSGNGRFNTSLRADGRVEMDSVSGELSLSLPKASSAQFQIESFSGDISSAIGKVVKEEYGPGQSLDARLGDGKARVNLNSMSGDVTVELR